MKTRKKRDNGEREEEREETRQGKNMKWGTMDT